jgi:hypothetical protein
MEYQKCYNDITWYNASVVTSYQVCGEHNGRTALILCDELEARKNDIGGTPVSDIELIKSRVPGYYKEALCPKHRYLCCEGYKPIEKCFICFRSKNLKQIGVKAATLLKIPIRKCLLK